MMTKTAAGLAALMLIAGGAAQAQPAFGGFNMDANGDGMITLSEMKAARVARMMAMDANHDGKVSREEFEAARKARMAQFAANGGGPGGGRRGGRMMGGPGGRDPFKETDLNGDGFITKAEVEQAAAKRFAEIDTAGRGYITQQQLMASFGPRPGGPGGR
jgi:hypothetical protein